MDTVASEILSQCWDRTCISALFVAYAERLDGNFKSSTVIDTLLVKIRVQAKIQQTV